MDRVLAEPEATAHNHQLKGLDAVNFPSYTEGGPQTDEYTTETPAGYMDEPLSHSTSLTAHSAGGIADEKGVKYKIVTFTEHDPENPRNKSVGKKWFQTLVVSFTCFAVAIGSSLIVMDMEKAAIEFNCNIDIIHLTVTLFVFGFGIGPLFFAPLSEIAGRRPVIVVSMGLYFLFTFPSAFAHNKQTLVIGRALAGLSASAPMTVIGGSIADLWDTKDRGLPMAIFSGTVFIGPVIGPVIAGFLTVKGWRANYYLLLGISGAAWLLTTFFLPETYAVVILRKRAQKLRKETGDESYVTEQELHKQPLSVVIKTSLVRPMQLLFTEPIVLLFTLYLSLIYALLYLLFFAVPIVFGEIHGWPIGSIGLAFIPILIGMMLTFGTVLPWQAKHYARKNAECEANGTTVPPETRLPSMMVGSIVLPIGFFIFAWTSYSDVHWIAPCFGTALFGFAMIAIYVGANSYIVDSFSNYAASAMAAKTFLTRLVGGAIPMFVDRLYHSRMQPRWASCLLALIATCMLPIPFVFYRYGSQIRAMSKRSGAGTPAGH
ncbi:hypothetical protein CI109_103801 [Kwoniella shandongensis]|uniref:Uncharacterized protein n=1 Tax=Kwoniella shandongensis TaxID=1734106 RepID=A0A5M6C738_9TREE|nr:uncharacterized protein CI109_000505 [Kwoniella shandongensis]KAA5530934.1 hypothetical protein CI109_000505 [Kwoniella shandongensis]